MEFRSNNATMAALLKETETKLCNFVRASDDILRADRYLSWHCML